MDGISEQGLEALTAAGRRAADESGLQEALDGFGRAVAELIGADAIAIRVADEDRMLGVRAVISRSEALAAELAGSRFSLAEVAGDEDPTEGLPEAVRRAGRLIHASGVLLLPAGGGNRPLGSLEAYRGTRRFEPAEVAAARLAAAHLGLVLRAFGAGNGLRTGAITSDSLSLAGDALAAGLDQARGAEEVVRVAALAAGAEAAVLWAAGEGGALELLATAGPPEPLAAAPSPAGVRAARTRSRSGSRLSRTGRAERWRRSAWGTPRSVCSSWYSRRESRRRKASWTGSASFPFAQRTRSVRASAPGRRRSSWSTLRPCSRSSARRSPSSRSHTR